MRPIASWLLRPLQNVLGRQADRLRQQLDDLTARLRDNVVHAVAEACARVVREVLRSILGQPVFLPRADAYGGRPGPSMLWHEDHRDPDGWYDDLDEPATYDDDLEPITDQHASATSSLRWPTAAATGLRLAAWVVQHVRRYRLPALLGVGFLATMALLSGSSWVSAGVGLLGALACLLPLGSAITGPGSLNAWANR